VGPPIKNQGSSASNLKYCLDRLQAIGYYKIMKGYTMIEKIKKFFSKKKKPETVTITQTEYDNLVDFWNEHHS
tara:strand:- start:128 stop:346 length:219 start_codon:yes stop_codon:yes gene_type:complete